jgi:hypothetical protein
MWLNKSIQGDYSARSRNLDEMKTLFRKLSNDMISFESYAYPHLYSKKDK